jgi:hypothetical protein
MSYKIISKTGSTEKAYTWVEKLLEKAFYESNNKRHDWIDDNKLKSLSQDAKNYLEELYIHIKKNNALYLTAFKDKFKKEPNTTDEKIYVITSNHFGGFGRTTAPQTKLSTLPLPPNNVINDIIKTFMDNTRKKELVDLGKKLGLIE